MVKRIFLKSEEKQKSSTLTWDEQAAQITKALEAQGIRKRKIKTNGYIFRFPYRGFSVEFANHGTSLSGTMHRTPSSPLEESCLEQTEETLDASRFYDADNLRILRKLDYRRFDYKGNPAQLVAAVIRLAEAPLDKVIAEQGYVANGLITKTL